MKKKLIIFGFLGFLVVSTTIYGDDLQSPPAAFSNNPSGGGVNYNSPRVIHLPSCPPGLICATSVEPIIERLPGGAPLTPQPDRMPASGGSLNSGSGSASGSGGVVH